MLCDECIIDTSRLLLTCIVGGGRPLISPWDNTTWVPIHTNIITDQSHPCVHTNIYLNQNWKLCLDCPLRILSWPYCQLGELWCDSWHSARCSWSQPFCDPQTAYIIIIARFQKRRVTENSLRGQPTWGLHKRFSWKFLNGNQQQKQLSNIVWG